MKIKTSVLVVAAFIGTLGFAGRADAQSMYGTAYGTYGSPVLRTPSTIPPAMYSANWVAPTAGAGFANRGYSPYTAGNYSPSPYTAGSHSPSPYTAGNYYPSPYTAGVPRGPIVFTTPNAGFGTVGGVVSTDRFGAVGLGSPTDRFRNANSSIPGPQFGSGRGTRSLPVYGVGSGARGTVVVPRRIR